MLLTLTFLLNYYGILQIITELMGMMSGNRKPLWGVCRRPLERIRRNISSALSSFDRFLWLFARFFLHRF